MAKRYARKLLLAKTETTSGTAEALAAADDAILATNVEITPIAGETVNRELERPYYGASADINVNTHTTLAFSVEYAGSGTAGTAPAWGRLLKACGMAETIVDDTSVAYSPVSTGEPSLTIALNIDGVQQTLVGCRGTFALEFAVNAIPRLRFTFTGKYAAPTDTALAAGSFTSWKDPVVPSSDNTPAFELLDVDDLALTSLQLEWGATVTWREAVNEAGSAQITDRASSGQVTFDAPSVADLAVVDKAKQGATGALLLKHGTAAGSIIQLDMPKVSLNSPSNQESNGIWQVQANYVPLPNAASGNDEIKFTLT